jgi:two-component system, chemotaxis family, CheB/CheR fusion protein
MTAKPKSTTSNDHYIIAIGASAGGLEAINEFFDNFPLNNQFSFVIIQHLSPDYKSLLAELLTKHTQMQVSEAEDGMEVRKNCVYVIPNNKVMTLEKGRLLLWEKSTQSPNFAIDIFFKSLAEDQQGKAIAIVLSGTGTDGTKGLDAVKKAGGFTLVQDPLSAKFDGMPNSAITSGNADVILSPEFMPEEIYTYLKEKPLLKSFVESSIDDENILYNILKYLHKCTGQDFTYYKRPTLIRRVTKRMAQQDIKTLGEYYQMLQDNPSEVSHICKEFLIGVTKFFRDSEAFDMLSQKVIPQIVTHKSDFETVKIWVTACSTGEEAYSIAILFDEYIRLSGRKVQLKLFATDLDKAAVNFASRGEYPLTIASDIAPQRLEHYFRKQGQIYAVSPYLRKLIVFAHHDIIKDPPFSRNDLVSCRNMLIYMNAVLQKKVLSVLHFSLNPEGFLFLGSSESPSSISHHLAEVDRKWKIFQNKNGHYKKAETDHPAGTRYPSPSVSSRLPTPLRSRPQPLNILQDFKEMLSEEYGYSIFYIDRNYEVKEAVGNYTRFVNLPEKSLSLSLLRMVHEDLAVSLGTAIRRAVKEKKQVTMKEVKIRDEKELRYVDILVKPFEEDSVSLLARVMLGERRPPEAPVQHHDDAAQVLQSDFYDIGYITSIETELKETRENLQAAIEELETANEELQSSNEELLSANEELQSSNEELQSLNEELHTVNSEHQLKIKELVELNDDLSNYFRSSHIGQLFLDEEFRIRRFNPAVNQQFNLIENDVGRPLQHLSNNLKAEDFNTLLDGMKDHSGDVLEREVELGNGRRFLMRIQDYIRQDRTRSGYVLSFVDITDLHQLNSIIKAVFNSSVSAIIALSSVRNLKGKITDFEIIAANSVAHRIWGHKAQLEGKTLSSVFPDQLEKELFDKYSKVADTGKSQHFEHLYRTRSMEKWFEVVVVKLEDGVVASFTDITDKKESELKLNKSYERVLRAEEELRHLNAELEKRVKERTRELSVSEERFQLLSKATNDAVRDWKLSDNSVWYNENFGILFGYSSQELTGGVNAWLDRIHPEDRARVHKGLLNTINSGQKQWTAEYRFITSGGSICTVLDRGYIYHDEYGTPVRVLCAMLDVTMLRKAQEDFRKSSETTFFITESMPQLVWIGDEKGNMIYFNRHWQDYTGLSTEELKQYPDRYIHPDDLEKALQRWKESVSTSGDLHDEQRIRKADGTYRWHIVRARAKKENNEVTMWIGTTVDIHDQKVLNEVLEQKVKDRTLQLQRSYEELEKSNYDLLQFASVASHDLKEPLRKIQTYSSLIRDRYSMHLDGKGQVYAENIVNTSARMRSFIDDLLVFSRLSNKSASFEPVDLNVQIAQILGDLEISIQEKHAAINVLPLPVIECIPGQMRQLFQNLISNSLKFSRPGVPSVINVEASVVKGKELDMPEKRRDYCRMVISDNGIGFQNAYAEKIFVIFQRLHTRDQVEGTGIGLAIVKKIIEIHGGRIEAQGKEGEGARFLIVLPVKQGRRRT